ncbi:putative ribonuclease H-like domain-containing protein [Tanacetum coccineum]
MTESPLVDSSFVVHVFSPGDDPIACLNKAMDFLTAVASLRFKNAKVANVVEEQKHVSNNDRKEVSSISFAAAIGVLEEANGNTDMVEKIFQVLATRRAGDLKELYEHPCTARRKKQLVTTAKSNATSSGGNNASGQARVVKCYNCQGEGYMARQCTQPKRPRNATWYKYKAMLAEAQKVGQILDEEQLAFLADLGVPDSQAVQTIIPNNVAFQNEDLDTYDSDCDDISNAKAVLMDSISNYGSDVISKVPHSETYLNDMENQSVHAMQDFKQSPAVDFIDNEIHKDINIILYSQYLQETQQANVQDTYL